MGRIEIENENLRLRLGSATDFINRLTMRIGNLEKFLRDKNLADEYCQWLKDNSEASFHGAKSTGITPYELDSKVVSVNPMTADIDGNEAVKWRWGSCAGATYNPNARLYTSKEISEWWRNHEAIILSYKYTITLRREYAEELLEYLDDNDIHHTAQASAGWVTITYYADETDAKQIANYIQYIQSDERYSYHSGDSWDV